jgi:hypothetical protein
MLLGFALSFHLNSHVEFPPVLFLDFFSPLVEELEFRGFGVLQLDRGHWLAILGCRVALLHIGTACLPILKRSSTRSRSA